MRWIEIKERTPQKCEQVLIRYEVEHKIRYAVAWYDAGLWWLDARRALSRHYAKLTHWTEIEPPISHTAPTNCILTQER